MVKIFVGRLPENVDKTKIEEMFKEFGEVTDCTVLKNYGFVHMANEDEAKAAITGLDKHELDGNPINVELSTTKVATACRLYIGNLPADTKSAEIHKLFKKYGTVIDSEVVKNFAFVNMGKESMAREAIEGLNDTTFNGNKITVQRAKPRRNDAQFGMMFPGGMRGRGRGFMGMMPMRGMPRFPFRPFMGDPTRGAFPPRGMQRGGPMGGMFGGGGFARAGSPMGARMGRDRESWGADGAASYGRGGSRVGGYGGSEDFALDRYIGY